MDLNKLYYDHQSARIRASAAISDGLREFWLADAARLAEQIARLQRSLGAAAANAWTASACEKSMKERGAARLVAPPA